MAAGSLRQAGKPESKMATRLRQVLVVLTMPDAYHRAEYQRLRLEVLAAAGWQCQWPGCHRRATTVDHVTPLAYGGSNAAENLRASCWTCNSRGGAAVTNELRAARRVGRRSRRW